MKGDVRKYVLTIELERSRGGEACSETQERCFKDRSEAEENAEHFASMVKAQLIWILIEWRDPLCTNQFSTAGADSSALEKRFLIQKQAHRTGWPNELQYSSVGIRLRSIRCDR